MAERLARRQPALVGATPKASVPLVGQGSCHVYHLDLPGKARKALLQSSDDGLRRLALRRLVALVVCRDLISFRRPCAIDAFATSSYDLYSAKPFNDITFVIADVNAVLP